jgi:hypothetical protein
MRLKPKEPFKVNKRLSLLLFIVFIIGASIWTIGNQWYENYQTTMFKDEADTFRSFDKEEANAPTLTEEMDHVSTAEEAEYLALFANYKTKFGTLAGLVYYTKTDYIENPTIENEKIYNDALISLFTFCKEVREQDAPSNLELKNINRYFVETAVYMEEAHFQHDTELLNLSLVSYKKAIQALNIYQEERY